MFGFVRSGKFQRPRRGRSLPPWPARPDRSEQVPPSSRATLSEPALPRSLLSPLGDDPCCGDMLAALVAPSLGPWLLRATRCLPVATDRDMTCYLTQHPRHLGVTGLTEGRPTGRR